jgi:hypothetical protein
MSRHYQKNNQWQSEKKSLQASILGWQDSNRNTANRHQNCNSSAIATNIYSVGSIIVKAAVV